MPKPMKDIRVKGAYDEFKEVKAAQGIKVAAKDLEKAIAGLSLRVALHEDEIEVLKELVDKDFKQAMRSIKVRKMLVVTVDKDVCKAHLECFLSIHFVRIS